MSVKYIIITIFCCFLSSQHLAAQEQSTALDKVMDLSGSYLMLDQLIESLELEQVRERIVVEEGGLTELERRLYFKELDRSLITQKVKQSMAANLVAQELETLMLFYSQPLAGELKRLYQQADADVTALLKTYVEQPPTKERIKLIHALVDGSMFVEQEVYIDALVIAEKTKTSLVFFDKYVPEREQELEYHMEVYKENRLAGARSDMILKAMLVFSSLSDDELRQLKGLVSNKARLRYQVVFVDALSNAVMEGVRRGIIEVLRHRQKRPS